MLMGDAENLCTGRIQSGITISTCLDLKLGESPGYFRPGRGKSERLGGSLDITVDVRDELSPAEVQGLSGATVETYLGIRMGTCLALVQGDEQVLSGEESCEGIDGVGD
jgi:hypothetical protein